MKVGSAPKREEGRLRELVRGLEILSAVEERYGSPCFEIRQGESALEALLAAKGGGNLVIVAVVEFLQIWPPLLCRQLRLSFRHVVNLCNTYPEIGSGVRRNHAVDITVQNVILVIDILFGVNLEIGINLELHPRNDSEQA